MEEKAIRRLRLVCGSASRFPTVMVNADRMASTRVQEAARSGKATKNRRTSTAKPAAFEAVDRNPATGVGAPSYTSGAQKWNGTTETLKPIPTKINPSTPKAATGEADCSLPTTCMRFVVPVKPNKRLKPYSMT